MDDTEESITGQVRTLAEAGLEEPASMAEALIALRQLREENRRQEEEIRDLHRKVFLANVIKMANYDEVMRRLRELRFPKQAYSSHFVNNDPSLSSVPSKSLKVDEEVDMSKFRYETIAEPLLCPWKEMSLLTESTKEFVVGTLFGGNAAVYDDVVNQFAGDLEQIRNVFCYYRGIDEEIGEKRFRPLFVLWLGALMRSIPADSEDQRCRVLVKERGTKTLSFQATLKLKNGWRKMNVKGYEDLVVRQQGQILVLGELKSPFTALCPDAILSLRANALSQMYAELQGFMAPDVLTIGTETAAGVAAAAPTAAADPAEVRAASKKISFITDGFVLRVSFGCPHVQLVAHQQLPPVYTSGNSSFLHSVEFTQLMLFTVAAATGQCDIDFAEATKDFFSAEIGPENASDADVEHPPSRSRPNDRGSRDDRQGDANIAHDEEDCLYDESTPDDEDCLTWDNRYDEFLEEERRAVGRLNALLDPSYLSEFSLQKLGTRHPVS